MSALLDEIIAARKAKAIEYEEYLKRIAELAKRVEAGQAEDTPATAGHARHARRFTTTWSQNEDLALRIDEAVKKVVPGRVGGGRPGPRAGHQGALYAVLQDDARGRADLPDHQGAAEY